MDQAITGRTPVHPWPVHLWIVGGLATLWNAFGAYNYLITRTRNTEHLTSMMPDVDPNVTLAWVDNFPIWAQFGWGLGVWAGLLGSLLLLARSGHAVWMLASSLLGAVLAMGYQLALAPPQPGIGGFDPVPFAVVIIAAGLLYYARRQRARGVLR